MLLGLLGLRIIQHLGAHKHTAKPFRAYLRHNNSDENYDMLGHFATIAFLSFLKIIYNIDLYTFNALARRVQIYVNQHVFARFDKSGTLLKRTNEMTKYTLLPVYTFMGLIVTSVLLAGCVIHVGASDGNGGYSSGNNSSYSSTNKSVSVGEGLNVGDVSSVNGSVTLSNSVIAKEVSSVNGRVKIGDNVTVSSVELVNGKVSIGENFSAAESVETVNGNITIGKKSSVAQNIETVNGNIELTGVSVGQDVETTNGSVYLNDGSVVNGDVIFEGKAKKNNWRNRPPVLKVDANSDIKGKIIIFKEVEFDFADSAMLDKVERRY